MQFAESARVKQDSGRQLSIEDIKRLLSYVVDGKIYAWNQLMIRHPEVLHNAVFGCIFMYFSDICI